MTLAEILALLARWNELTPEERTTLNDALSGEFRAGLSAEYDADGVLTGGDLHELSLALTATADAILDLEGGPDDDALEALEWVALQAEAITAENTERVEAANERANRAAELADRIRGGGDGGGDDPEAAAGDEPPAAEDDEPPAGDEPPAEGDEPESAEQTPEPVAASGGRVSRVNARRPAAARPTPAVRSVAPLVASANVPGASMGARLDDPERLARAFSDTISALSSAVMRPGQRVPVAHAEVEFPEAGFLDGSRRGNAAKLARYASLEAVTAAGGICAVPTTRYDLPGFSTSGRPVVAGLTRYGADRGGVELPAIPTIQDLDGAVSFWTLEDDIAAVDDPEVRKPCLRIECEDPETTNLYAVVQCLEIGNFSARTWPERLERMLSLADSWQARQAESRLLTRIGALSTQVTVPQNLGTARDVLTALDLAGAAMRNRHRMLPETPLRWMAPATLRDNMRSDLTREMPGSADERLAAADAYIDSFFAARHINVSWFLDGEAGQVFGTQSDGALLGWMPNVVSYLYPEGSWLYLDGGELNLGVMRDTTNTSRNDMQMFKESFETVAFWGVESLRLSMSLCPTGAAAGTVEPVCTDVASS